MRGFFNAEADPAQEILECRHGKSFRAGSKKPESGEVKDEEKVYTYFLRKGYGENVFRSGKGRTGGK